jgi:hypothetical protein
MKTKITAILTVGFCLLGLAVNAQTDTNSAPPAPTSITLTTAGETILDHLKKATNYAVVPYLSYGLDNHKVGGGVLALYNFNDFVGAGIGADYLGSFSLVSGNVQLKVPIKPLAFIGGNFATNFTATPFIYSGMGTPISGAGNHNGGISTHAGAGAYFDVAKLWGGEVSVGAAWITRTGAGAYSGKYLNGFVGWRHGF